jgi:hypothetical protein
MSSFKRDKKEEEDGGGNPFQNIEKTTVLQEARVFNDTTVNPRKCTHILTKLLYLLNQVNHNLPHTCTTMFSLVGGTTGGQGSHRRVFRDDETVPIP